MNVVDSSGWLEYFADAPNAEKFAPGIQSTRELVVPTLSIYEVFKRVLQQRSETEALRAVALMLQGRVVDLNTTIAMIAAVEVAHGRQHHVGYGERISGDVMDPRCGFRRYGRR